MCVGAQREAGHCVLARQNAMVVRGLPPLFCRSRCQRSFSRKMRYLGKPVDYGASTNGSLTRTLSRQFTLSPNRVHVPTALSIIELNAAKVVHDPPYGRILQCTSSQRSADLRYCVAAAQEAQAL